MTAGFPTRLKDGNFETIGCTLNELFLSAFFDFLSFDFFLLSVLKNLVYFGTNLNCLRSNSLGKCNIRRRVHNSDLERTAFDHFFVESDVNTVDAQA